MKPKIKLVDWGLANNFGNYIEMHKDLPNYPNLWNPIIKHEMSHTDKFFTWHDLALDFKPNTEINRIELYGFMLRRPKTWIQFLPFYFQRGKGFIYDVNKIILWAALSGFAVLDFTLIKYMLGKM